MKEFKGRIVTPGTVTAPALVSHGGLNTLASFQKALQFGDKKATCGDQNNPDLFNHQMAGSASPFLRGKRRRVLSRGFSVGSPGDSIDGVPGGRHHQQPEPRGWGGEKAVALGDPADTSHSPPPLASGPLSARAHLDPRARSSLAVQYVRPGLRAGGGGRGCRAGQGEPRCSAPRPLPL